MELSYRIIKNDYVNSSKDKILIDTDIKEIEKENYDDPLELHMNDEVKEETLAFIEDYKKKVNFEIEVKRKNILENAKISAELEAMDIREKAYKEGYNEAYNKAIEEAKEEAKKIKEDSLDLLKQVKIYRDNYIRENEENIYGLAKAMAEKIIDHIVDIKDENILLLVKPILVKYLKEEDVTITTTKKGKEILKKHIGKLELICPNTRFIFLEDKSIGKNGFIIEDSNSVVNLDVKAQLENMVREISDKNE